MRTAGILLAAGRSERFGSRDKLLADLAGSPLVSHAAGALRTLNPDDLLAVATSSRVAALLPGFRVVKPDAQRPDQSDSLRAGIAAARACGADRALIVLGDMPLIPTALLRALLERATAHGAAASKGGVRPMPPACFGRDRFAEILGIRGDEGARRLLSGLPEGAMVRTAPEFLTDVDTPDDLQELAMYIGPPRQRGKP